jgi:hypothetical protein
VRAAPQWGGREATGVRHAFSFRLFLSCFLFCPRALDGGLPFPHPGFDARVARAGTRTLVRGDDLCGVLALGMRANVCTNTSACHTSLGLPQCKGSGSDMYPSSARARRRS